jgi:hypothetical protein
MTLSIYELKNLTKILKYFQNHKKEIQKLFIELL